MRDSSNVRPLSDSINIQSGFAFKSKEYTDSGHFLVRIGNVQDGYLSLENPKYVTLDCKTARFDLQEGDFLTSLTGNIGRVARVENFHLPAAMNQRVARLSVKCQTTLNKAYLFHFLSSNFFKEALSSIGHGAAQQNVSPKAIGDIEIPLPPPPEQKRIVAILDDALERIGVAVANAEKNLANARELFESYLNLVFTQKGEGWVEKPLGEVCVLQRGFDLPKPLRSKGEFPLVSSSGIIDSHIEAKVAGPGVVTGRSGSIGKVFYVEEDFWPLNTVLYVKEFFGNEPQFVYHLLHQIDLEKFAGGTGVPTLNRNNVHGVSVSITEDVGKQRRIIDQLDQLSSATQRLETLYRKKLDDLAELKQSILQKAFRGELTSNDNKEGAAA
ncbi:restriction endonuclease subunit S [Patescibacteria group bacterium]|nr:restriction endonuclease subunit S [Patescibacteria group bacterium]